MKRKKWTAILLAAMLLTGCGRETAVEQTVEPTAETAPVTQPAEPVWISQEQAMIEGFVVIQDGDVWHNYHRWQQYLDAVELKQPAAVTVMHFLRTDAGSAQVRHDLSFDGSCHRVTKTDGQVREEMTCNQLLKQQSLLDDGWEPYDSVIRYLLVSGDAQYVLFEDLIAQTDFTGVQQMDLHRKEGEPPLLSVTDPARTEAIIRLLSGGEYLCGDPEEYCYGAKLLMQNGEGKQLVLELDLNRGNYRYGMQTYRYGEISELLSLLGLERWPEEIYQEFGDYIQ